MSFTFSVSILPFLRKIRVGWLDKRTIFLSLKLYNKSWSLFFPNSVLQHRPGNRLPSTADEKVKGAKKKTGYTSIPHFMLLDDKTAWILARLYRIDNNFHQFLRIVYQSWELCQMSFCRLGSPCPLPIRKTCEMLHRNRFVLVFFFVWEKNFFGTSDGGGNWHYFHVLEESKFKFLAHHLKGLSRNKEA